MQDQNKMMSNIFLVFCRGFSFEGTCYVFGEESFKGKLLAIRNCLKLVPPNTGKKDFEQLYNM